MRTEEVKVLKYEELDDRAKEKARSWYTADNDCYGWHRENMQSLEGFAEAFNVKILDYNLGGSDNRNQHVKFELQIDDNVDAMGGVRLWKWFNNQFAMPDLSGQCPFTGYCFDETLLDPIRKFMQRPSAGMTYKELIQDCVDEFCTEYANDVDYTYSDEAVAENIIANEYEFTEDGERWL